MTMKKDILIRLYLTMMALLSSHSCRQDILPEKETYHNTSAFQLTSKRISLNESKHKAKLLPELKKAEAEFKAKTKSNAFGKIVNFGNSGSIDTDDVIYIENGTGFHSYTFNIKHDNAPADAPVENLLLSLLPDGTYKELLVTYNFTSAEKQTLMDGGYVNTNGKTTVTELATGTYSGVLAKTSCSYETVTVNLPCTSEDQHMPGQSCDMTGDDAPKSYTLVALVCGADTSLGEEGTPGGGVSIGEIGGLGGNNLTPTQPNVPVRNNPCNKTKAMLENPAVQTKLNSLKNHSTGTGELGFKIKKDGTTSDIIDGGKHEVDLGNMTGWQGAYHNHTSTGIPMHSPPDIDNGLLKLARSQPTQPVGEHNNAYFGMIVKKACSTCTGGFKIYHYVIRFNGNYDDAITNFSQEKLDELTLDYQKLEDVLTNLYGPFGNTYIDGTGRITNEGLEILFFETLKSMNLDNKLILQRVDDDGNGNITVNNITLDADGLHTTASPCP